MILIRAEVRPLIKRKNLRSDLISRQLDQAYRSSSNIDLE